MTRNTLTLIASVSCSVLYAASPAVAQTSPSLGNAASYAVLAGSTVTNTGATTIAGDVGISPGIGAVPHFTGFGTVVFTSGSVHDADGSAANARASAGTAFGALDQGCTFSYAGTKELAGVTLLPGVHCATSFHLTSGALTLQGSASNVWIFKSASDLIITGGAASRVISPSCNVWWRVVSTATLDAGSSLTGNILASTSVTLAAGATLSGRAFASTAEVTLSSNAITSCAGGSTPPGPAPAPAPVATPTVTKGFSPAAVAVGGESTLTINLTNNNAADTSLTAAFTDTLPAGVVIAANPRASTTCTLGLVAAPIGGSTVTLTAGSIIPSAGCSVVVAVIAAASGTYVNTIPIGALVTTVGSNAAPASATLAAGAGPSSCPATAADIFIVKSHTTQFVVGTNVAYSIALFNQGGGPSSGVITVTDTLPTGLTFVSATGVGWTCSAVAQVVTCTNPGPAATGTFPNNITLTVNPAAGAVPGVTNTAAVTGGTDCNLTNNATADVTLVALPVPVPVPTLPEWAFILLASVLAGSGFLALRKRTAA